MVHGVACFGPEISIPVTTLSSSMISSVFICPRTLCHSCNDLVRLAESDVFTVCRKKSLPAAAIGNCVVPNASVLASSEKITLAPFFVAA